MSAVLTGCILPPDGKRGEQSLGPYPPQVDLAQVFPRKPRLRFDVNDSDCESIELVASGIIDRDSAQLLFRWVANNNLENTILMEEESVADEPGAPLRARERIDLSDAFGVLSQGGAGVLSLFITDSPEWLDPNPVPSGESADLSQIPAVQDEATVVEVRWTFEFVELGG